MSSSGSSCVLTTYKSLACVHTLITYQVPETKGLTLEEMDEVFGDQTGSSVTDQERLVAIHRRIGLTSYVHDQDAGEKHSVEKVEGADIRV